MIFFRYTNRYFTIARCAWRAAGPCCYLTRVHRGKHYCAHARTRARARARACLDLPVAMVQVARLVVLSARARARPRARARVKLLSAAVWSRVVPRSASWGAATMERPRPRGAPAPYRCKACMHMHALLGNVPRPVDTCSPAMTVALPLAPLCHTFTPRS